MQKADITKYQQKFWQKVEILSAAASAVSATQNRIDAESADISALDADDFTDVTLAKVTLLM